MLFRSAVQFPDLTVNAYNPWAFVGPEPLIGAGRIPGPWTPDDLPILGIPAHLVGLAGYLLVTAGTVALLWRRPDRHGILVGAVILLTAFFVVPTRVHERYLFGAVAIGLLLLPRGRGWWAWAVAGSAILIVNMHAILTLGEPWTGTPALRDLPFGDLARSPLVATVVALATIPLLAWPIVDGIRLWRERPPAQPARGGSLRPDSPPSTAIV